MEDVGAVSSEMAREPSAEDYPGAVQTKYLDDASDVSEESLKSESLISLTLAKEQYAEVLQEEMEDEYNRGLLISKQQYDQLRYEDEKIIALRNAKVKSRILQYSHMIIIWLFLIRIYSSSINWPNRLLEVILLRKI